MAKENAMHKTEKDDILYVFIMRECIQIFLPDWHISQIHNKFES